MKNNRGVCGPNQSGRKPYGPQQTIIQPPKGYVPPLRNELTPIGVYNTSSGYWVGLPIEALVEALVQAEQLNILGILSGREEDYDLQTLAIPLNDPIATPHDASLTVPDDEVWFLSCVEANIPATIACSIGYNWYCSLWPDHASASPTGFGQSFHGAEQNGGVGGPWVFDDEFGWVTPAWLITNKTSVLRLPPGTVVRCRFVTRTALGEAINCTFQLFGFIGKYLVG